MRGERSALIALYAAKIEATRRSVPPRERMAAIRALIEERRACMRAVTERRQMIIRTTRERRDAERHSERQAQRHAGRDDARPT